LRQRKTPTRQEITMLDAAVRHPDIAAEALAGLTAARKTLPPKLFYDTEGVRLFDAITRLPEYYLTRAEMALLRLVGPDIARLAPAGAALIEYGASDEAKARFLLTAAGAAFASYVPIDVAQGALDAVAGRLRRSLPALAVHTLAADFGEDVVLPAAVDGAPKFGFFPGSTIGNFYPDAARAFLRRARRTLGAGAWLVVGADPCRDPSRLLPAYNDAAGVTAAFNRNVLVRLNREAAADFDPERFTHLALWNEAESRMEMHLCSSAAQRVRVAGVTLDFAAGETIHTENSYKYDIAAFHALAADAGWTTAHVWTDPDGLFAVHGLRADGED
jgi:dimethylhistidine N-methyltransferase